MLSNLIHVITVVWSCASSRFHLDRLKIVDSGALKNGKYFIFSRGNVGANINYYPLNRCVCGWSALFPLTLRVAKQQFNVNIDSCRSVSDPNFRQWWNKLWMNKARALLTKQPNIEVVPRVLCRSTAIIRNDRIYWRNQAGARRVWGIKNVEIIAVWT